MEKIEIKDFADIKDITIEVKQINILIGPQASGKSVIAKLLYYFKNFIFEIIDSSEKLKDKRDLDKNYKQKFKEYFPSPSWGNKDFKIKYYIEDHFIEINRKKTNNKKKIFDIVFEYSELYKNVFIASKDIFQERNKIISELEKHTSMMSIITYSFNIKRELLRKLGKRIKKVIIFHQLYIPAGRSFFAYLKNSIFAILSENNTVDPFLADFGTFYEKTKSSITLELINEKALENKILHTEINLLNEKILCGQYLQKSGEDYLKLEEGRTIKISNSSSGQQETLPLIIIMRSLAFMESNIGGNSVYIEEPEAHIFPAAQKSIVELISTVYNTQKDSLQFFITTHSPYILTAFNNLLQAGILSIGASEEKIAEISRHVPQTRFLKPGEVAVYSLENGYCKSIIDEETGLIDTNIIDEVSNELAIQFDELLELEE